MIRSRSVADAASAADSQLSVRVLRWLIFTHLLLVVFQLPIRAMVVDTTFIRDIGVFSTGFLLVIALGGRLRSSVQGVNGLDVFVGLYLLYGVLLVPVAIVSGVPLVDSGLQFRNHFMPLLLFFAARHALASPADRARLISVFGLLALVLSASVLVEWIMRARGMSAAAIPWARYAAETSDRFVEGVLSVGGNYVTLDTAPILGLFGWPHYSVVPMLSAFALTYPFLVSGHLGQILARPTLLDRVPRVIRMLAPLWVIAASFALAVTMHLITAAIVLLILPWVVSRYLVARTFWVAIAVAAAVLLMEPVRAQLLKLVDIKFVGSDVTGLTIDLILAPEELLYVVNRPAARLLFGDLDVYSGGLQAVGSFENRLVFYTAAYGVGWLVLFGGILAAAIVTAHRQIRSPVVGMQGQLFGIGCLGLLVVVGFDMFHYARLMTAPNTDMLAIVLGSLSAQEGARRKASQVLRTVTARAVVADPLTPRHTPQPLHV